MKKAINMAIFLLATTAFAQQTISGKIIDSENKKVLAYVNIGIKDKSIGTVSDSNGIFNLKLTKSVNGKDKIVFSHIGYVQQEHGISTMLNNNNTIILDPETTVLNEVVLQFKAPKAKKIGRKRKGLGLMHSNFYSAYENSVDDRLSKEMGMRLPVNKDCKISGLNFNITSNDFKSLKFRVNFYRIKNGFPDEILNTDDVIFEIKNGHLGWFNVDLTKSDMYLEKDLKEVAVTIQWLESEKNDDNSKYFSISTAAATSKNFYYREKAMDKWLRGKSKLSFYLDAICK